MELSQQQLIDCDTNNDGCKGGVMSDAFSWLEKAGGITTEEEYPFNLEEYSKVSSGYAMVSRAWERRDKHRWGYADTHFF